MDEAIAYLRRQAGQVETIYEAYVLDADQCLLGVVSLRDLLSAARHLQVRSVMRTRFQSLLADDRHQAVAKLMADHRLLAVPVLNRAGVMQGIVTIDDAMRASRDDTSLDIQKAGGLEAWDGAYLETGILRMIRKRAGWLSVPFVGEMLTATAMGFSEHEIRHWWRVLKREVLSGIALGLVLCSIGVMRIPVWQGVSGAYGEHFARVALTVGASLVGVVLCGTIAGGMLPLILRACRLDPASASAPAVATLVDVSGLIIYSSAARLFILRGLP